jgi:hypothetical protein
MERFWWSGEIEGDAFDPYRETMRAIQSVLCPLLEQISLGNRAEQWAYIAIIRTDDHPDYEEIVKRTSKGKVLEFRLKIPFAPFISGSRNERIRLVLRSLSRCVSLMENLAITREVQDVLHQILLKAEYALLDTSAGQTQ